MTLLHRPRAAIRSLLESESGGGIVLICAAAAALFVANSPVAPLYFQMLEAKLGPLSLLHWINDALMALFFLLIGLEIKREFIGGELSSWQARSLPGLAAIGGMIVPALIYIAFNSSAPQHLRGWAVPTATDIAFALGVLALLGSRVPQSLKVFLTALAIIDDLGAVAIIALVYSNGLSLLWLGLSAALGLVLGAMNRAGIQRLIPYLLVGGLLWFCVHRSGVHATLAGIVLAMAIPVRDDQTGSPLHRLEHALQPWIGYLVVPLFGFANAGVALSGTSSLSVANGVPVGTAAGLFLGKQLGVFSFAWASIRMGLSTRPEGASTAQLYGVSTLCGIGFTMSLFIGLLAFPQSPALQDAVKVGVLAGSLASALLGTIVLITAQKRSRKIAADKLHS